MAIDDRESRQFRLREQIRREREAERLAAAEDIYKWLAEGEERRVRALLLFHTEPKRFSERLGCVLDRIRRSFREGAQADREMFLRFLVRLAVDLQSFLPYWNLMPQLSPEDMQAAAEEVVGLLEILAALDPEAHTKVKSDLNEEIRSRFEAEGACASETPDSHPSETEDPKVLREAALQRMARAFVGASVADYVRHAAEEIRRSNLFQAAVSRRKGAGQTELGNDYAAFLPHMMRLGGSFVTTNPVLIGVAWEIDEKHWDSRVDELIGDTGRNADGVGNAEAEMSSLVTMGVVEENCRLLRDIFLLSEGREGYVSLQVNPNNHGDGSLMVKEARALYRKLEHSLGGVPNVVFKLPATAAGLSAAEELTSEAIGVTITVCFSVSQAVAFAEVLSRGSAMVSYIALMNGRMAYPVRDELREAGISGGTEAARWAGVEVARKAYRKIFDLPRRGGMGVDPNRVKLLIASLRIYDDWVPDISELWGCQVITFFPDVRRKYDAHPRDFRADGVFQRTPEDALEVLAQSEIFKQAWWLPDDGEVLRPAEPLSLLEEDHPALLQWPPVAQTLSQFTEKYEEMRSKISRRARFPAAEAQKKEGS